MILFQAQIEEHQRLADHYRELASKREALATGLLAFQQQADSDLALLKLLLSKCKEVAPGAIASLKTAVLGLFTDGDDGNDGGNQPTPDNPTPGAGDEPIAIDANGEEIGDGDRVEIINGGLSSGDIGTAMVVGDNYLEVEIDNPSDSNQDTAGITYKHSQDVVKVDETKEDTLTPGSILVDEVGSFGVVIGTNNLGIRVDWLGIGSCPNPASGKGVWFDWKKDESAIASLFPGSHDRIKLLTTEEFLQFQGWESDQLDEHWDNEWFEVGVGCSVRWSGATIKRWILVFALTCEWASPFASPLTCLLWEDAPLLGQACAIQTTTYVELIKVTDAIAYQRQHNGEILCCYFGFRTKAQAQSWLHFFEAVTSKVELRQAKRLEGYKWEIKAKGVSLKQIDRYSKDCDFSKSYRSEVCSSKPPGFKKLEIPQPVNLEDLGEGDIVTGLLTPSVSYRVVGILPNGILDCQNLTIGDRLGLRASAVTLVQKKKALVGAASEIDYDF